MLCFIFRTSPKSSLNSTYPNTKVVYFSLALEVFALWFDTDRFGIALCCALG